MRTPPLLLQVNDPQIMDAVTRRLANDPAFIQVGCLPAGAACPPSFQAASALQTFLPPSLPPSLCPSWPTVSTARPLTRCPRRRASFCWRSSTPRTGPEVSARGRRVHLLQSPAPITCSNHLLQSPAPITCPNYVRTTHEGRSPPGAVRRGSVQPLPQRAPTMPPSLT